MSTKRILWVVPKYTFPISDGARVASDSLIQSLKMLDNSLDVLSLVDNNEKDTTEYKKKWGAHKVFLASRPAPIERLEKLIFWIKKILIKPFSPLTLSYFRDRGLIQKISSSIDINLYDVIIFDGLHGYAALDKMTKDFNGNIIYRAHNVEQDLWTSAATKVDNYFISAFYKFQGFLMGKFENKLIERSAVTWTISNEDQIRFKQEVPNAKYLTIPVGMNFLPFEKSKQTNTPIQLFFLGRLDWAPNKEGLRWFLDEVWPELSSSRSDIVLNIGGSGNGDWLSSYLDNDNLVFHGLIDDLSKMYSEMDLAIMPIFFGSGTRIKVIEAACFGLPIISTRMGVQGSGLREEHFFHAESSKQWINTLANIERADLGSMSNNAWEHLRKILDYKEISKLLKNSL